MISDDFKFDPRDLTPFSYPSTAALKRLRYRSVCLGSFIPWDVKKQVAIIDENTCIGCTLCIQSCPVDAIVGAAKQLHTVVAAECTGCELCLAPCPVDCIAMEAIVETVDTWKWRYPVFEIKARAA